MGASERHSIDDAFVLLRKLLNSMIKSEFHFHKMVLRLKIKR